MVNWALEHVRITGGFWAERLHLNSHTTIFHQWEQLELTRCIDNFRIAAGLKNGFREGYFFADSDAYKWLDAASRILAYDQNPRLKGLVDEFIAILEKAQEDDGYLYTYNQIHFGTARWQNLQIEHEFYCLGHLIEAGVSHQQATGEDKLSIISKKAADLLVSRFWEESPRYTDGHEEIEIALIRLSRHTGIAKYRELAKRFLQRRGTIKGYWRTFIKEALRSAARMKSVNALRNNYYKKNIEAASFKLPLHNKHKVAWSTPLRFIASALSGKYAQQHLPLNRQVEPVGHAVRFAYLNTAAAMLARDELDNSATPRLERIWDHMVSRRMYVSGGIGSLPLIEGFGRDYELDPEMGYNETCAALGSMLWAHEMSLLTAKPKYDDLFEWQLYNAASVGIGTDGCTYFYNNPLTTSAQVQREAWYDIPCCPSNLSRVWAAIADHIVSFRENEIRIHHYLDCDLRVDIGQQLHVKMETSLPWEGDVRLRLQLEKLARFKISLRRPAWTGDCLARINGQVIDMPVPNANNEQGAACGLNFGKSATITIDREFANGDEIHLLFSMPVRFLQQDARIPRCGGLVAVSRGPMLYCLETSGNQDNMVNQTLGSKRVETVREPNLLGGVPIIRALTEHGEGLTFIPYSLWGNRGKSAMTVFVKPAV